MDGRFDTLFQKISLLGTKGQTFDLLFSVGNTLTFTFDIKPYISQEKKFPLPTYFLDSSELSFSLNELYPDGKEICENFKFLGKSGIKEIEGLKIAFLNGVKNEVYSQFYQEDAKGKFEFSGCYYTKSDIDNLISLYEDKKKTNNNSYYIDFFLSIHAWLYCYYL